MTNKIKIKQGASAPPPLQKIFDRIFFQPYIPRILGIFFIKQGKLVFSYTNYPFCLSAALIDQDNSNRILWRSASPLWQTKELIKPLKMSLKKQTFRLRYLKQKQVKKTEFPLEKIFKRSQTKTRSTVFDRVAKNPILTPISSNDWESLAVFNCAALYLAGRVHLVYRAIGESGLSNFGYASSSDGIRVDKRSASPIYVSNPSHENAANTPRAFSQRYQSGANWGGYEDPRLTQIDDTIYMTYTAFDGVNPPGVALTSIRTKDFLKGNWNWRKPALISAPQQAHKNWVIFPQKINGKFAILHSLTPDIRIDYYDDLDFQESDYIASSYQSSGRDNWWDNCMRGVGSPPLKTEQGWLVLYHAMDKKDPDRYKVGAMLLDLNEPTKIIYRSPAPLLEPDARYENNGFKSGVVYTCGALIIGELLYVYYGGAYTVVCAAFIKLERLLEQLKSSRHPILNSKLKLKRQSKRAKLCLSQND